MTSYRDRIRLAQRAGVLSKEALGFFWAVDYCEQCRRLPSIRQVKNGVEADYGECLSVPAAGRVISKVRRELVGVTL